jgi:hypothetical protein
MASQDQAHVFSGHTAKIMIGNKEHGYAQNVSFTPEYGLQDVAVIGQTTVVEHQQTRYIVSGELAEWEVRDEILDPSLGLMPATASEAVRKGLFDLAILDKITGKPFIVLEGVTLGSSSAAVAANTLVTKRITFRALNTRMTQTNG